MALHAQRGMDLGCRNVRLGVTVLTARNGMDLSIRLALRLLKTVFLKPMIEAVKNLDAIQSSILILFLAASCSTAPIKDGYVDASGLPLSSQNQILRQLNTLFSGSCPQVITITPGSKHQSEFHVRTSTIELGTDAEKRGETMVLTHETTHLCMARLTHGASTAEHYRFYDEGFASIVGGGYSTVYKERALATASKKARKGEVSFAAVQKWSEYFGEPPKANYEAYDVGASFIFFAQDTYGKEKLFTFFRATGNDRTLDAACKSAFGEPSEVVEQKWIAYLGKVVADPAL